MWVREYVGKMLTPRTSPPTGFTPVEANIEVGALTP